MEIKVIVVRKDPEMEYNFLAETARPVEEIFKNPPSCYRGIPFWAWNGSLKKEYLLEQIDIFKKMGFGGAHMHVRLGFNHQYLGEDHMYFVRLCTEKFKKENMYSWIYDEDRCPSGTAGGYLTQNLRNRIKSLVFSTEFCPDDEYSTLTACYDVVLTKEGYLSSWLRTSQDKSVLQSGIRWYAYKRIAKGPFAWYNDQTYADTMNPDTVKEFLNTTYESYKKAVGSEFGKTVPAIFTDEPNYGRKGRFQSSFDKKEVSHPWTEGLENIYKEKYDEDILDYLPEVFWELPCGKVSVHRYRLQDIITELFASSYCDECGRWCDKNGIALTGHLLGEGALESQTWHIGEAMRSYRSFIIPGIDILHNNTEFSTAKQCQSTVHQYDRKAMLSELYGVTNWDFDFRGHKFQGDWQAALGVTVRVPHLAWYSMEGEAKRDYPASVGYQSPWYEQYHYLEDHFARINTALTQGVPEVRIGVIHPIESFWLHYGAMDKTDGICSQMEWDFQNMTRWLLFGMLDFDYICESTLPQLWEKSPNQFTVGKMKYDVILIPKCETLRSSTLEKLEEFADCGGRVIFMGTHPTLCDAMPSERGKQLYERSEKIPFEKNALIRVLSDVKTVSAVRSDGSIVENLIYQMRREENGSKWLFVANGVEYKDIDITAKQSVDIIIKGKYTPVYYDTLSGEITKIPFRIVNDSTVISKDIYSHDSLLYHLEKYSGNEPYTVPCAEEDDNTEITLPSENLYSLSEDNVYLLDMAEYKLNDGVWQRQEEILRLDNICRKILGFPPMGDRIVQPWVMGNEKLENFITLRYTVESEIDVPCPFLAAERIKQSEIILNGKTVTSASCGFFADRHIEKIALPPINKGINILEITCPIGRYASMEYSYLLGNFGVKVIGKRKVITGLPGKICFDDIRHQGLPFYGANITYKCEIETVRDGKVSIHAPVYRGALVTVRLDGTEKGKIVFSPYTLNIDNVPAGKHILEFTLYGNRFNCFGQVHCHHHPSLFWYGPMSFRTTGDEWTYEYETKPMGILRSPVLALNHT